MAGESTGEAIPVVRLTPTHASGRLTVIADSRGKAALATAAGQPSALARALLAAGQSVVGFDPLFVGESVDAGPTRSCTGPRRSHFETYNPSLAADQMQDLATVLAWARSQPDIREVSLVGQGLAGPQVLLARPLLEGLARTVVDLSGWPDSDGSGSFPAALDLPGLFQFGGLKAAAALSAPAPLWIARRRVPRLRSPGPKPPTSWRARRRRSASPPVSLPPEVLARWIDRGE